MAKYFVEIDGKNIRLVECTDLDAQSIIDDCDQWLTIENKTEHNIDLLFSQRGDGIFIKAKKLNRDIN